MTRKVFQTWRFLYGKVRWIFSAPEKKQIRVKNLKGIYLFQAKKANFNGLGFFLLLPPLNYSCLSSEGKGVRPFHQPGWCHIS